MHIKFSRLEGEFPYKADYIGFTTPPIHPRLNIGGVSGRTCKTYGDLLEQIISDLRSCSDKVIEPIFGEGIEQEKQDLTRITLTLLKEYNALKMKLGRIYQARSE